MTGLLLAVALVGCSSPYPQRSNGTRPPAEEGWTPPTENVDYGEYPTDYEEIAKEAVAAVLKDPESARFGRVSLPRREHAISNQFRREAVYGYSSCIEVNAKNSYGGYTGFQAHWLLIRNGRVVRIQRPDRLIYIGRYPSCEDGPKHSD